MNILKIGLAAAVATMIGTAAQAGTIIHDSADDFSAVQYTQGTGTIDPSRLIEGNIFDNDSNTILSLGLGGSLDLVIDPANRSISGGTVIELTNLGSNHAESAQIYLGLNDGDYVLIGEVFNNALGGGATFVDGLIATLSSVEDGANTSYFLTVFGGNFNSLRIVDSSPNPGTSTDGFDIAKLSVTSVPEPATLALLGAGLLGLGGLARRKAA
jgi:hypothetical protein